MHGAPQRDAHGGRIGIGHEAILRTRAASRIDARDSTFGHTHASVEDKPARRGVAMSRARAVVAIVTVIACGLLIGPRQRAFATGTVGAHASPPHDGYILLGSDGGIFNWNLPFNGSPAGSPGTCAATIGIRQSPVAGGSCLALAVTPSGDGYWVMNALTGLVFGSGDAGTVGTPNDPAHRFGNVSQEFLPQFRQIVSTPSGHGYWVYEVGLNDMGTVDPYGDAVSYGDTEKLVQSGKAGGFHGSPVGMAATPDGKGYWEVYSDGGVFSFGDAHFYGSTGSIRLAADIVGITATADGKGYWLVASDGGVFAFGDAHYAGSMGGHPIGAPAVGMARNPAGPGYWLTGADGGVYSFGGAHYFGSVPQLGVHLHAPIVAIVARTGVS
jgi:hypothetical protein